MALVVAVALGEWAGWPFLAAPLGQTLSSTLGRRVRIGGPADAQAPMPRGFSVRFLGGVRLTAAELEIAAPTWSEAPHLLLASSVVLELRYRDLWRARRGDSLRIHALRASTLDGDLERLADGRSSWQLGAEPAPGADALALPRFGRLGVDRGTLRYRDAPMAVDLQARLHLVDFDRPTRAPDLAASTPAAGGPALPVFQLSANGHYRNLPLKVELASAGVLPWVTDEVPAQPVALTLDAQIGRAELRFKGSASDALRLNGLDGHFDLRGPSLAAVGDPIGVTLPTTAPFRSSGQLSRNGDTWTVVVADATVGTSRLDGRFSYDTGHRVPLLSGQLGGPRLMLMDLGPVVGTTSAVPAAAAGSAPAPLLKATQAPGKVLPDRPFDLPALRVMDADVRVDIVEVDLNTRELEPLRPLRAHLQLAGGVLTLGEIDAGLGRGRLKGELGLDGRASSARWSAKLRWDGVQLEHWVRRAGAPGAPTHVSGRLAGRVDLQGQGRSTAQILASLKGEVHGELQGGTVSHLLLEVAGLDIAQALGVMLKGDDALPVQCAVANLAARDGVLRPRAVVLDTRDSVVWVDGTVSMVTETLDLRAVVTPRDLSPMTLRTPLHLRGSFVKPELALDKGPVRRKAAAALLLALVDPLAALIPFIDLGDDAAATRGAAVCHDLVARAAAQGAGQARAGPAQAPRRN